jgi:hypothetical protein
MYLRFGTFELHFEEWEILILSSTGRILQKYLLINKIQVHETKLISVIIQP